MFYCKKIPSDHSVEQEKHPHDRSILAQQTRKRKSRRSNNAATYCNRAKPEFIGYSRYKWTCV